MEYLIFDVQTAVSQPGVTSMCFSPFLCGARSPAFLPPCLQCHEAFRGQMHVQYACTKGGNPLCPHVCPSVLHHGLRAIAALSKWRDPLLLSAS